VERHCPSPLEKQPIFKNVRMLIQELLSWLNDISFRRHSAKDDTQAVPVQSPSVPESINNLPVEILQRIFTCCAEPRSPDETPFPEVYPEWIALTYVNRHWRAVAIGHHTLWGSVTPNLSPDWLGVLVERSEPAPVDAELRVGQTRVKRICLGVNEVTGALAGCTRLRSLRLVGPRRDVCSVLDALRTPTPIHSLTLSLWEPGPPVTLPEYLFGGETTIRHIHFTADRCIVAPPHLLRGVTHFTSGEQIPLPALLDALCEMPALTHLTLQYCRAYWQETDVPRDLVVDMPHLSNLVVRADSPRYFVLLNEHLSIPNGAKRWLELHTLAVAGWDRWLRWFSTFSPLIKAANGLQHAYLSGGAKEGTFRLWTDTDADCENPEFCFDMYWYGSPTIVPDHPSSLASPIFHLATLCDILHATPSVHILEIEGHSELPDSLWWELLRKLQAVKQLMVHSDAAKALYVAWSHVDAPTVLPYLEEVRLVRNENLPAATTTSTPPANTLEPQTHAFAVRERGRLLSRIIPSRSPRPETPTHAAISHRPVNEPQAIRAETALELIRLLHGRVGQSGA